MVLWNPGKKHDEGVYAESPHDSEVVRHPTAAAVLFSFFVSMQWRRHNLLRGPREDDLASKPAHGRRQRRVISCDERGAKRRTSAYDLEVALLGLNEEHAVMSCCLHEALLLAFCETYSTVLAKCLLSVKTLLSSRAS